MGFPLILVRLYVCVSMIWVSSSAGVVVASVVEAKAPLVAAGSGFSLGGVDWLSSVMNTNEVRGIEHVEPL